MKKDIRKEKLYDAPIDRVWEAITNADSLSAWFMETDFQPTPGFSFTFKTKPQGKWDGLLVGEVLKARPPHRLQYTWQGNQMKHVTIVEWRLEQKDNQTLVVLSHTGFKGFSDTIIGLFHGFGWNGYFRQLKGYLGS